MRSALVLKGLTNAPTGAIVAAPTTSLPEAVGGVRNWDYRYSWLRDAAMNLYALFTLGYTDEAHAFMGWLERTTAGRAEDLQLMYGVGGERLLPELEPDTLDGYRGSRPVRIGNAADGQFQLDVYGYLLDTAWLYHRHGGPITPTFWRLLAGAVEVGGRRHFVASKVMAWVAVDRAIRLAALAAYPPTWTAGPPCAAPSAAGSSRPGSTRPPARSPRPSAAGPWTRPTCCSRWSASSRPRTPYPHHRGPHRPRARPHGLVHRYLGADDGLPGGEASFVICSFWLVDNLAWPAGPTRLASCSSACSATPTTWGCWATSARPSATSG